MMVELSDEQLLFLVGETDKEMFESGMDIRKRDFFIVPRVMRKLGYVGNVPISSGGNPTANRIVAAYRSIYRPRDLASGGHIGVFMFRDVFARISMPHIFGTAQIDLFESVDLTPIQLKMLAVEPRQLSALTDQICDVADIQYGVRRIKIPYSQTELVLRFIDRSRQYLHAAAAVLTGGYDPRGAAQSALLATELALKSAGAAVGISEGALKHEFGHDREKLARAIGNAWPGLDTDRILRVLATQPNFIGNRYAAAEPDRLEIGHLAMGAQFVVAEIFRQLSGWSIRRDALPHPIPRTYPA